jgi:hypothetical protein
LTFNLIPISIKKIRLCGELLSTKPYTSPSFKLKKR